MDNIKVRQVFRNKKNKCLYRVLLLGKHTETEEEMVIYRLVDDHKLIKKHIWVRPLKLFKQKFEEES